MHVPKLLKASVARETDPLLHISGSMHPTQQVVPVHLVYLRRATGYSQGCEGATGLQTAVVLTRPKRQMASCVI